MTSGAAETGLRRWSRVAIRAALAGLLVTVLGHLVLQQALLWMVNRQLVGHAAWRQLRLGAGVATLLEVRVADDRGQEVARIPEIRVAFALDEMWRRGSLAAALREVLVLRPRLDVRVYADGHVNLAAVLRVPERPRTPAQEAFQGRIRVQDGTLSFRDERAAGFSANLAGLDGEVDLRLADRGRGHFYVDEPARFRLDATWRRSFTDPRATLQVDRMALAPWSGYVLGLYRSGIPPEARGSIGAGRASLSLLVSATGAPPRWPQTTDCSGALTFEGLEAVLEQSGLPIRGGSGHVILTRDLIHLQRFHARAGADTVEAAGRTFGVRDPQVDFTVSAHVADVARTFRRFGVRLAVPLQGSARGRVRLLGRLRAPRFVGSFHAPRVRAASRTLADVSGAFHVDGGVWRVDRFAARMAGGSVQASGWILPARGGRMVMRIQTRDTRLQDLMVSSGDVRGRGSLDVTLVGRAASPLVMGSGQFRAVNVGAVSVPTASGSFAVVDRGLLFYDVDATTQYGRMRSSGGFVDLGRSQRMLLALRGSGVDYAAPGAGPHLRGAEVDVMVAGTPRRPLLSGRVRAGSLQVSGLRLGRLDGFVHLSPDTLWLPRMGFAWQGMPFEAGGVVILGRTPGLALGVHGARLDVSEAVAGLPGGRRPFFALRPGVFDLDVVGERGRFLYAAALDSADGRARAVGAVSGRSRASGVAIVEDFNAAVLDRAALAAVHPAGRVDAAVLFAPRGRGLDLDVTGRSRSLSVAGLPFTDFSAQGSYRDGSAHVDEATLFGPAGMASGRGRIPFSAGPWDVAWRLDGLDLGRLARAGAVGSRPERLRAALRRSHLADVEGRASGRGRVDGLSGAPRTSGHVAVDEARLHGEVLSGALDFHTDPRRFHVNASYLKLGSDRADCTGWIALHGGNALHLDVTTPRWDLTRALAFTPSRSLPSRGWLDGHLLVQGTPDEPTASGTVGLHHAMIAGQAVDEASVALVARRRDVLVRGLTARAGDGRLTGRGSFSVMGPLCLNFAARDFPLTRLTALPTFGRYGGRGDFDLRVGGTAADPRFGLSFKVRDVRPPAMPPVTLAGGVDWSAPRLALRDVRLTEPDGASVTASGSVELPRSFAELLGSAAPPGGGAVVDVQMRLERADVAAVQLLAPSWEGLLAGAADGSLHVEGPLRRPHLTGDLRGTRVRVGTVDVGKVGAVFAWQAGSATPETLELHAEGPGGRLDLAAALGREENRVHLQASGLDVAVLQPFVPGRIPLEGRLDAGLDVAGPIQAPTVASRFKLTGGALASVRFDRFTGALDGQDGVYHLDDFRLVIARHQARLSGTVPLRFHHGLAMFPAPLELAGETHEDDLNLLSLFVPDMLDSPGRLDLTFHAAGQYPDIKWLADLRVRNGSIRNRRLGAPLEDLQAHASVLDHRLQIERCSGRLGNGTFNLAGGADLQGFGMRDMNFTLRGQDLSVMLPPYLSSALDVDLHLTGATPEPFVGGRIAARRADFRLPLEELTGSLAAATGAPGAAPRPRPRPAESARASAPFHLFPVRLSVDVDLGPQAWLHFLNSTVRGEGQLTLIGRLPEVVPTGVIDLRQGQLQIPLIPSPFRIVSGKAYFEGTAGWMPNLEVTAGTTVSDYDVFLDLHGPANDPEVRLSSNPPLPQQAIHQLLFLGQAPQPVGVGSSTAPAAVGALVTLVQTSLLSPITTAVSRIFALSEVTFELVQTGGTQIRVTKALDALDRFFLTFSYLQGVSNQSLPRSVYGFEWRFVRLQLVRVSTDDKGQVHFYYQARWRF